MSDFLLQLSENPNARKVIKGLGLPIPMPQKLRRAKGPWEERPLKDYALVFGAAPGSKLIETVADTLGAAGADPFVAGSEDLMKPFRVPGEAYGRPPQPFDSEAIPEGFKANALVFDATGIEEPSGLHAVYDFFHPLMRKIKPCGRIVVLGRPPDSRKTPEASAAQAGLEGFARSAAKEIGKKGSTAQVVYVEDGAEDRLPPLLRFLLSPRSAFVTAQPFWLTKTVAKPDQLSWTQPLENKVALVTGAARGIGAATARLLAAEGAHVVCLDLPSDDGPVSKLAREIGGSVLLADISDEDAPQLIASELKEKHGGVDVVIHNAGITRDKTLANMKPEKWDQAVDVNLASVIRITKALLAGPMRDGGRIVCLSSVAGIAGNMGQTNYAASKSGLIGYIRHLAKTTAKRGITVNAVAPGFIETRLTAAIPMMIREGGRRLAALGQGGLPQDVGEVLCFLSTPGASGLTGTVNRVCGGALIGA